MLQTINAYLEHTKLNKKYKHAKLGLPHSQCKYYEKQ